MNKNSASTKLDKEIVCGIIMPISAIDDIEESHWLDVRIIIEDAISKAGFKPRLVSDSDQSRFIHNTIITNLYNDEIVVCDVSAKNPNVMFELGLRLAFNKPVVIIIDDATKFNFDIGILSHLPYRRDLRHRDIEKFKDDLTKLIINTHDGSLKKDYRPFLSHFGEVKSGELGKGISANEYMLRQIDILSRKLDNFIVSSDNITNFGGFKTVYKSRKIQIGNAENKQFELFNKVVSYFGDLEPNARMVINEIAMSFVRNSPIIDMQGDVYSQIIDHFKERGAEISKENIVALEAVLNRFFGDVNQQILFD